MSDGTRSSSIASRSARPGPITCSWPTNSSSVGGRSRCASGADASSRRPAASLKRSPTAGSMLSDGVSEVWGAGTYERLAARFAPVQDELLERLRASGAGERVLDLATGTGEVALRAAARARR